MEQYEEDGYIVTITDSGAIIKELKPIEVQPAEPQTTLEEQIYAENLYQTALLEMQALGGV